MEKNKELTKKNKKLTDINEQLRGKIKTIRKIEGETEQHQL
jgi:NAD+--asparagine ADP-ribosyltransferase